MRKMRRLVDPADRARQFMPFAALRGYEECIKAKEYVPEPKKPLTEEDAIRLSERMDALRKGDVVKILHYEKGAYRTLVGAVSDIDEAHRVLRVVKRIIDFDDIADIE